MADTIRDLAWPLKVVAGRFQTVEQGSLAEVQQGVDLTFECRAGSLVYDKAFGVPNLAFTTDPAAAIERIARAQPRVADVTLTTSGVGGSAPAVTVQVTEVRDYAQEAY